MPAAKRAIDPATANEIQTYVGMIRTELTPIYEQHREIMNKVATILIAIDEATGKKDPD